MKLYGELAQWWPLMSPPEEYETEAWDVDCLLAAEDGGGSGRLPLLGAGGGHLASHLKSRFEMTLVDISEPMLEQSRRLNSECRHLCGAMSGSPSMWRIAAGHWIWRARTASMLHAHSR